MPKKAGQFAQQTSGESFKLDESQKSEKQSAMQKDKIVLNIGRSKKKIRLHKRQVDATTGNVFIDYYHKINKAITKLNKVKIQEKAIFFRLLAVMVEAGIPLVQSLHTLAEQNKKNPKFQDIISKMAFSVEAGESLSGSMERHLKVFSEAETGMIRSGEVSGHLNDILKNLAKDTEKSSKTIAKVKSALTYPMVIMGILFVVLFLMMTMVIPQMTKLFTENDADLPAITAFVVALSDFLRFNTIWIIGGIAGVSGLFTLWVRTKSGKYYWHSFLLRMPVIGILVRRSSLAQFARNLGNLLGSGVSIVQSLSIISNATNNAVYKRKIKYASDDIRTGIPLAETLRSSSDFPIMFVNMLEVGEQTAQLETVCARIADFYDEQVDLAVKGLTKAIEPLIMVFVGVVVGGLVAAIMLPIMSLADVAGNV